MSFKINPEVFNMKNRVFLMVATAGDFGLSQVSPLCSDGH